MQSKTKKKSGGGCGTLLILLVILSGVTGVMMFVSGNWSLPFEKKELPTATFTIPPTGKPTSTQRPTPFPQPTQPESTNQCPTSDPQGVFYELADGIKQGVLSAEMKAVVCRKCI